MRKTLITVLALLVLVIGGSMLWISMKGKDLLRTGVENYGPRALGAEVTLADLSLSPFSGKAGLKGLVIGNPEGFSDADALILGGVSVHMEPLSVFSDVIAIDTIRIDAPTIRIEPGNGMLNLQKLQRNLEDFIGPQPEEAEPAKSLKIEHFYLTDASISVGASAIGFSDQTLSLADIHLENIGGQEGIPPAEAARLVFDALMPQVQKALASQMGQQLLSQAREKMGDLEDQAREQLDAGKDKLKETIQQQTDKLPGDLKDKTDDAIESGIGGLLGTKKKTDKDDEKSDKNGDKNNDGT